MAELRIVGWLWLHLYDVPKGQRRKTSSLVDCLGGTATVWLTAVTNSTDSGGLLLVLIIFVWTPPHFWALAIERKEEYALVNMPMLPVTHGESFTRLHILLYTILLLVCSYCPS